MLKALLRSSFLSPLSVSRSRLVFRRCFADPNAKSTIERLQRAVEQHNHAYYKLGKPLVSDDAYDSLVEQLKELQGNELTQIGSSSARGTWTHTTPMLSLESTRDADSLTSFIDKVFDAVPDSVDQLPFVVELKYDGMSAAVHYQDGELKKVVSRGDGHVGEDITAAALHCVSAVDLPRRVVGLPDNFEVRGEVVLAKHLAPKLSPNATATPRNVAAGLLMRKETDDENTRHVLSFRAFGLLPDEAVDSGTYTDLLQRLRTAGFATCDAIEQLSVSRNGPLPASLLERWQSPDSWRPGCEFDVDGLVLKIDPLDVRRALGFRPRSPRWALALKFASQQAVSTVTRVSLQVGRSGVVTPIAELAPVRLGGVLVTRASLHNFGRVLALQLTDALDDAPLDVVVARGGDVIPHVVSRADGTPAGEERDYNEEIARLQPKCPCARQSALQPISANVWRCVESDCAERSVARRVYICQALGLNQLGQAAVRQLTELELIQCDADLLRLSALRHRFVNSEGKKEVWPHGWGVKRFERVSGATSSVASESLAWRDRVATMSLTDALAGVRAGNVVPLWRAVTALGAEGVGQTVARTLARQFKTFAALMTACTAADEAALLACEGVGDKLASALIAHVAALANTHDGRDLLATLALLSSANDEPHDDVTPMAQSDALAGQRFVLTGALQRLTRSEAIVAIEAAGGTVLATVAKSEAKNKLREAKQRGVQVIDEDEFLKLLENLK